MKLLRLVRWFGVRRGFRMWRRQVEAHLDASTVPHPGGWAASHGERPAMPGYRRRGRRAR